MFALFLREDAIDKWDLCVAAPWIEENRKDALSQITNEIQEYFTAEEISMLSRVVLVGLTNPEVIAVNQAVRVEHGQIEIRDSSFFGLPIEHAYIITSETMNINEEIPA